MVCLPCCREFSQSPGGSDPDFPSPSQAPRDPSARSDISADSIERSGRGPGAGVGGERFDRSQARWLEELKASGAKIVQVTYPRTANNDKELTVIRGEFLEVILHIQHLKVFIINFVEDSLQTTF